MDSTGDYKIESDIAADRNLTPSSSHLDSGAVAPAIYACERWDTNIWWMEH